MRNCCLFVSHLQASFFDYESSLDCDWSWMMDGKGENNLMDLKEMLK